VGGCVVRVLHFIALLLAGGDAIADKQRHQGRNKGGVGPGGGGREKHV
jgi:hypothetical protein